MAGLLEELAMEKNVKIHLYTRLVGVDKEGKHIRGIFVSDKESIHYISASVYIDATGDGDLSVMAGASYTQGNPATGKNQPISLRYVVGGVNTEAFCQTYSDSVYRNGRQFCTSCKVQDGSRSIERALRCGLMAGDLVPEDLAYWQIFAIPNRPGAIACNCPEFFDRVDGTKALDLTNAQLMGKQAIERHLRFYKKYLRGFENAFLTGIAPMVVSGNPVRSSATTS